VTLAGRLRDSRLGPVVRAVRRATWPRWRRVDAEDQGDVARLLGCVLREDSCALDVGAHRGSVLAEIVRLAPRGRHHAFEPLPVLAAELRARFPDVTVHELALSDTAGDAEFQHVVTDPGYSGLRRRRYDDPGARVEPIRVTTARLDDVLDPEAPVHFVKVDVEGAELQVFRGARRTLARWRPWVVFEHGLGAADHYGTTPAMVHALLAECGLAVFGLDGSGPYSAADLAAIFAANARWNFLARPYRA
jgi:FkbM family methyltransferase